MGTRTIRTGISVPEDVFNEFERVVDELGVESRSRAITEAMLSYISEMSILRGEGVVAGAIVVMYDHGRGDTARIVTEAQHHAVDAVRSTVHIHVTHDLCVEVISVCGDAAKIREIVKTMENAPGIRSVRVALVKIPGLHEEEHAHGKSS